MDCKSKTSVHKLGPHSFQTVSAKNNSAMQATTGGCPHGTLPCPTHSLHCVLAMCTTKKKFLVKLTQEVERNCCFCIVLQFSPGISDPVTAVSDTKPTNHAVSVMCMCIRSPSVTDMQEWMQPLSPAFLKKYSKIQMFITSCHTYVWETAISGTQSMPSDKLFFEYK